EQQGIDSKGFLEFFDCPGSRQGVEDLKKSGLSKVFWAEDTTMSTYLVNRNLSFNESGEYKKTFIGSGVGTGSV
ncbi:hypothetical protein Tco_1258630, partial [Tanacetum coccineum]